MTRLTGVGRMVGRLALLGAALPWAACVHAGEPISVAPNPNGPEIMFYFKQPLGAHASRIYGLRIDQASVSGGTPGSNSMALVGRRDLINLQVGGPDKWRLEIARRLTWDVGRTQIGAPSVAGYMALRLREPPR